MTSIYLPTPVFKNVMSFVGDLTKEKQKIYQKQTMKQFNEKKVKCEEKYLSLQEDFDFYCFWCSEIMEANPDSDSVLPLLNLHDSIPDNFKGW